MFSHNYYTYIKNTTYQNIASSIGSSLSRVSSSSPSSTPTDSESHGGHVVLQTNLSLTTSTSFQNNHVGIVSAGQIPIQSQSMHSSEQEEELGPPIANRPERTKSIVCILLK